MSFARPVIPSVQVKALQRGAHISNSEFATSFTVTLVLSLRALLAVMAQCTYPQIRGKRAARSISDGGLGDDASDHRMVGGCPTPSLENAPNAFKLLLSNKV